MNMSGADVVTVSKYTSYGLQCFNIYSTIVTPGENMQPGIGTCVKLGREKSLTKLEQDIVLNRKFHPLKTNTYYYVYSIIN